MDGNGAHMTALGSADKRTRPRHDARNGTAHAGIRPIYVAAQEEYVYARTPLIEEEKTLLLLGVA